MLYESEKLNARFGEIKKYIDPNETVIARKSIKVYCKNKNCYQYIYGRIMEGNFHGRAPQINKIIKIFTKVFQTNLDT